jgi:hypothetical protein
MTSDKSSPIKKTPVQRRAKLDAATLQNMAHRRIDPAVKPEKETAGYESAASLLEQLSPSNISLVENIIRVALNEQNSESE